jgi:hypothetical protein
MNAAALAMIIIAQPLPPTPSPPPKKHTHTHKSHQNTKNQQQEEVLNTARALGVLPGFSLLMVDTENKFVSTGACTHIRATGGGTGRHSQLDTYSTHSTPHNQPTNHHHPPTIATYPNPKPPNQTTNHALTPPPPKPTPQPPKPQHHRRSQGNRGGGHGQVPLHPQGHRPRGGRGRVDGDCRHQAVQGQSGAAVGGGWGGCWVIEWGSGVEEDGVLGVRKRECVCAV